MKQIQNILFYFEEKIMFIRAKKQIEGFDRKRAGDKSLSVGE
jgi:hypothetical protein